ncbi:hypothetical protein HMPREF1531_02358 [Propionibacterium sp. oral taxon 192 str. F0372]|uniref:ABC transporter permease n=1 Tax=Propionibacterium sp. oral taxon 192 TaxID=671222 RepID=UPI000354331B|nr:hypothetical protein HMPREF1531_02358 [Propionibacterium sp. oral taxon 192 str. F0372]
MMVMFLVTSISMQRERMNGALERLWTTRLHRADLLCGYAAGFACAAAGQSVVMCIVAWAFLGGGCGRSRGTRGPALPHR